MLTDKNAAAACMRRVACSFWLEHFRLCQHSEQVHARDIDACDQVRRTADISAITNRKFGSAGHHNIGALEGSDVCSRECLVSGVQRSVSLAAGVCYLTV